MDDPGSSKTNTYENNNEVENDQDQAVEHIARCKDLPDHQVAAEMVGHEHAGPGERDLADQEAGCNLDDLGEDGEWVAGGWSSP